VTGAAARATLAGRPPACRLTPDRSGSQRLRRPGRPFCGRRLRREAPLTVEGRPGHHARRRTRSSTAATRPAVRRRQLAGGTQVEPVGPPAKSHNLSLQALTVFGWPDPSPVSTSVAEERLACRRSFGLPLRRCAAFGDGVSGPFRAALKTYRNFEQDSAARQPGMSRHGTCLTVASHLMLDMITVRLLDHVLLWAARGSGSRDWHWWECRSWNSGIRPCWRCWPVIR
jgi:hypothetical protein